MTFLCDTTVLFAASDAAHQHHRPSLELVATATPSSAFVGDYLGVLRHVAAAEARSGQIHDALILKCAERADVETVYTWNTGHLERVAWPTMAGRIRTP